MTHAIFLPEQLEFVDRGNGSGRTLIGIHDALTGFGANSLCCRRTLLAVDERFRAKPS